MSNSSNSIMSNSSSSSNYVKFDAPEFVKVFQKINGLENKQGYYNLRFLSKFHAEKFEESINSAMVTAYRIRNLQVFTASKFVDQIRFLTVFIRNDLNYISDLCYLSPTFLPKIEKVNVDFGGSRWYTTKIMIISKPLIFRGINIIHDASRYNYHVRYEEFEPLLIINCKNQDIQIIESVFEGIGLHLFNANKITVQNSTFGNIRLQENNKSLHCNDISDSIIIDNVRFLNGDGFRIRTCGNKVSINNIYVEKCREYGCSFHEITELNLNGAEIIDCETGIEISHCNGNIQNCNIKAKKTGIQLISSDINYRQVTIKQTEGVEEEFNSISNNDSVFNEIL